MAINDVKFIDLPRIRDPRGNLTFIQNGTHLPFDIRRAYWIYDVPVDGHRDGHAFKCQAELIACLSGALSVTVDDGSERRTYTLRRPWQALLIPPMTWRLIDNFSTNAVGMVLASTLYNPDDYIFDYYHFRAMAGKTAYCPDVAPVARQPLTFAHGISTVDDCSLIELPRHRVEMGSLTAVENNASMPFDIKRVYYLYDVPSGAERGGHSHLTEQRLITALSGSFDVVLDDGRHRRRVTLNNPARALYIPPGIWRTVENFSSGSICYALSSEIYSEADYVRDYEQFRHLATCP